MKFKVQNSTIIILILLLVVFLAAIGATFLVSKNYQKIYNTPTLQDGVIDFEGFDEKSSNIDTVLSGKWEFFYSKWIVSDKLNVPPDDELSLPSRWTGMTINGEKLQSTGYASYKIILKNLQIGKSIRIVLNNFDGAFKAFMDDELVAVSGNVSKNYDETFRSGRVNVNIPYTVFESGDIELVIEVSNNNVGGLYCAPWIHFQKEQASTLSKFITYLGLIVIGVMLTCVVMSLTTNIGMFKRQKDMSPFLVIILLFLHFLCSKDVFLLISQTSLAIDYRVAVIASFLTAALLIGLLIYQFAKGSKKLFSIKTAYILFGALAAMIALYFILWGTGFQFISAIISTAIFMFIIFKLLHFGNRIKFGKFYVPCIFLLNFLLCMEMFDYCGLYVFGTEAFFSVILVMLTLLLSAINFFSAKQLALKSLRDLELEDELIAIKKQALRAQINPHFIFNTLTCIQSMYYKDTSSGDDAIEKFSHHLRLNIDSDANELVNFECEIENTINYFELENMRSGNNMNLLLDLRCTDFKVPVLSLQPIIENSIKYARTQEKENGFIQVSSTEGRDFYIVKIIDNGIGFDTSLKKPNSVGLANVIERFKLLLSASVDIYSKENSGTKVIIHIPKGERI